MTAYTVDRLDEIVAARRTGRPRVQLKVDTGLSRGGPTLADWPALVAARRRRTNEQAGPAITGVWSHFACSDEPEHPANDLQEQRFHEALRIAEDAGLRPEVRHLANSAAAILRPSSRFDLVRCGLASYGLDPAPGLTADARPAAGDDGAAPLALVKRIAAGEGVSYGHTWVADEDDDGRPGARRVRRRRAPPRQQRARGRGRRRRRPVRGRVCMDQFVVDLGGDLPGVGNDGRAVRPW